MLVASSVSRDGRLDPHPRTHRTNAIVFTGRTSILRSLPFQDRQNTDRACGGLLRDRGFLRWCLGGIIATPLAWLDELRGEALEARAQRAEQAGARGGRLLLGLRGGASLALGRHGVM